MTPSLAVLAAQGVTALLNASAASLPLNFIAERRHFVRVELKDLGEALHVFVVPRVQRTEPMARDRTIHDIDILVIVVQRLRTDDADAQVDALLAFTADLERTLRKRSLPEPAEAVVWSGAEYSLLDSPEALDTQSTFRAVLTITYQAQELDQ